MPARKWEGAWCGCLVTMPCKQPAAQGGRLSEGGSGLHATRSWTKVSLLVLLQVVPEPEVEEEDMKGQHHAQFVEMGGKQRRDQLNIRFPEFAAKTKPVSLPAVSHPLTACGPGVQDWLY